MDREELVRVRPVSPEDVPALREIYSYYVEQTTVSFEFASPSVEEFRRRVDLASSACPYLVYCERDRILGFAYARPAFERPAYAWLAETSVYVDRSARGRGIGKSLYGGLISLLASQGYKALYAIVTAENKESCIFHQRNGFKTAAVFSNAGFKFGRWLDVVWYERVVGNYDALPRPPRAFVDLSPETVATTLREINLDIGSRER
ncbi:MAG: N-acetyltransferase [Thermoguttaceae bacterium]|nr:N-acetyltransferase [Thermoguttaceae bacterium]